MNGIFAFSVFISICAFVVLILFFLIVHDIPKGFLEEAFGEFSPNDLINLEMHQDEILALLICLCIPYINIMTLMVLTCTKGPFEK